jgi:RNA polymerase sigma factor (TIGR02999 family)
MADRTSAQSEEFSLLLERASGGDRDAFDRVYVLLYDELSRLAHAQRARWSGNETLNTTVLVHEAYLKLAGHLARRDERAADGWAGRGHFLAIAALVMRHLLVNHAAAAHAAKRGGGAERVDANAVADIVAAPEGADQDAEEVLALDAALRRLSELEPRQARIVECRCFAGMSIPETAAALGISAATVKRDWHQASVWLQGELREST